MKSVMKFIITLICILSLVLLIGCERKDSSTDERQPESTKESDQQEGVKGYSPYARGYPQKVFFGDTHVHTTIFNDAFGAGNTLMPEDAYRFARGDEGVTSHGERVRINQPLDFLVVADHAEAYGAFREIYAANPNMMTDTT